ncbi:MAG: NAD(P)/FAD-dependent oxidoreductase [Sulfuricella sp.]|jgi:flavin-dependent dehydrogenase
MSEQSSPRQTCDVLVIGGGPAGSTAATLLAQKGHRVVLIEKDKFPRFHIGESLLPVNNDLFEQLGVLEQVARIGMVKNAAQFDSMFHGKKQSFYFSQAMNHRYPYSYEVHRAELDQILLDNCRAKGAEVHEETKVTGVDFSDPASVRVTTQSEEGESCWQARFLIDASGRDTFLANRFDSKQPHPKHASAAIYGHFEGVERLPGTDEGNITLFWFDHGWFWLIPLQNGITSVGMVCWPYFLKTRKTGLDTFFNDTVATCPPLAMRMKDAKLTRPVTATGNYSYLSSKMSGDRCLMLGDAFAFVDPIFSSGVLLAMKSAFFGADAVDACLRDPAHTQRHLQQFEKSVLMGLKGFTWLIFRMTTPVMREMLMNPRNILGIESAAIAILAGDVHDNPQAHLRMKLFKLIYYMRTLTTLPQSLRAHFRRRRLIRPEIFEN